VKLTGANLKYCTTFWLQVSKTEAERVIGFGSQETEAENSLLFRVFGQPRYISSKKFQKCQCLLIYFDFTITKAYIRQFRMWNLH